MKLEDIRQPVTVLPGVGPAVAKLFAALNVFTVADILTFYPRDYDDRTKLVTLDQFARTPKIHTVAKVTGHAWFGYGRMKTLKISINDGTMGAQLIAFNRQFLEKTLPPGAVVLVTGTFTVKYNELQSTAFEVQKLADSGNVSDYTKGPLPGSGLLPVYPLTEGLNQKTVRKTAAAAVAQYTAGIDDELPASVREKRGLLTKRQAVTLIHTPKTFDDIESARRTLIYEELYHFQYAMAERAYRHKGTLPSANLPAALPAGSAAAPRQGGDTFTEPLSPRQQQLADRLPYTLTPDQAAVIAQMNADIDRGYRERSQLLNGKTPPGTPVTPAFTMSRLLQGDVGSGKTLVAFFACLRAIDWGGQCALMAPTELLARQHAENAARLLEPIGIRIAFLTGKLHSSGRTQLLKALKAGDIDIVIGTHALFSAAVQYKDLQLVIIDEQHRFGVMQRNAIVSKGIQASSADNPAVYFSPHLLMMSATPIPQTLALTAFGDLDISTIRTMPQGRQPVTTYLVREGHEQNAYEAVRKELRAGHQAYFVYPAIDSDSTLRSQSLKAAEDMYRRLSEQVFPEYTCVLVHSKVELEQQHQALTAFRNGSIQILVATTVVEVGVDVPNATCMVIEHADRFGLAQLHQLRGRVGRGKDRSYCFLIYSRQITETGIARMKALRQNTDGFVIAEEDLKLRGPGELTGTIQAGNLTLGIADLQRDYNVLLQARTDAFDTFRNTMQHMPQDGACAGDAASV